MKSLLSNRIAVFSVIAALLLFGTAIPGSQLQAQTASSRLAVELSHPVYAIIETAELRGVLTRLSSVKPYTSAQVLKFLEAMLARPEAFSPAERVLIEHYAVEFSRGTGQEKSLLADDQGTLRLFPETGTAPQEASAGTAPSGASAGALLPGSARAGLRFEATTRFGLDGLYALAAGTGTTPLKDLWHLNSRLVPYLSADVTPWLSIKGEAGFDIDKIERGLYLPYSFSKEWDAGHISFGTPRYSNGELDYPSFSYDIRQDIAAQTDDGGLMVRLSRFRRDWGVGSGSFSLSGTARPFVGLEMAFRPSRFFAVSGLMGSLTNWEKYSAERSTAMADLDGDGNKEYTAISWQKMLGLQRMELFPFDWLTVSATSSVVGAKRFELGYMSPLLFSVMYQNQLADIDNLAVQIDGSVQVPRLGKLYLSFYADEMEITHLDELFTKARNMFALQGGAKIPLSFAGLSFATLTAQYTKIEPFVYAHYPTWYPDYRLRVDTSYTQDGENLGYYLKPNSDEFLVKFEAMPAPGLRTTLKYAFVRHGDNPSKNRGDLVVFGDVNKDLPYTPAGIALEKHFLHDGLYDFNHIASLNLSWRPLEARLPFELGLGYGFSYTWWEDTNGCGEPVPAPSLKNLLELSVKLFW